MRGNPWSQDAVLQTCGWKVVREQSASRQGPRTKSQSDSQVQWQEGLDSERSTDSCEGKPLKGEPQGRKGHETRPCGQLRSKPLRGWESLQAERTGWGKPRVGGLDWLERRRGKNPMGVSWEISGADWSNSRRLKGQERAANRGSGCTPAKWPLHWDARA